MCPNNHGERTVRRILILGLITFILTAGLACSGGSADIPISPSTTKQIGDSSSASHMLWGMWQVAIDTGTKEVEIVPVRDGMFHVNVVMYLQPPFPNGLGITINNMDLVTGIFDIEVSLTHPFDDPEYTGFDVKGIFITNGIFTSSYDPSLSYADYILHPRLLNADGYTRWWNMQEFTEPGILGYTEGVLGTQWETFTNTLNPFKYYSNNLDAAEEFNVGPGERNHFLYGTTNSRQYLIQFPVLFGTPLIVFNYAVDACWEEPQGDPTDLDNFPPEANQPEPYQISVQDIGSTAWYDTGTETGGGNIHLNVAVSDYGWSFNPSNGVADELNSVVLESQTLFLSQVVLTEADLTALIGDTAYFEVNISGVMPESVNNQEILIHAICAEGTYDQGFGLPAPAKPLTAYYLYTVPIIEGFPIPPAPTGLTADVTRDTNGKLNGFILDWDDTPGAEEYVVNWSTDPYETQGAMNFGIADNGVVTESSWSYNITVPSAEENGQWMLNVVARGLAGNPLSDSEPSGNVFIDFAGFEGHFEEEGDRWRIRFYDDLDYNHFVIGDTLSLGVGNSGALLLTSTNHLGSYWFAHRSVTYCVTPELPNIDGTTTCFFEYTHKRVVDFPLVIGENPYGYSICSTPEIDGMNDEDWNPLDFTIPYGTQYDYRIDLVDKDNHSSGVEMSDYHDYYIEGLDHRYNHQINETTDPSNGWTGPALSPPDFELSRYNIPKVIEEGHPFAGICYGGKHWGSTLDGPIPDTNWLLICDEFALVIY